MNDLSGKTHLWALVADPVAHVRAPAFVNPMFARKGLDGFLLPLHVRADDLADVLPRLARVGNLKAFIVTIPHKEAIARLCATLGPNANLIGAVNTVRIEAEGRLVGEMFDGVGLVATARANGMKPEGRRVLVLGAGGAGRAVAFALAREGAKFVGIFNRSPARALRLAEAVTTGVPGAQAEGVGADAHGYELVVNCTSLGLHEGDPPPLDAATLGCRHRPHRHHRRARHRADAGGAGERLPGGRRPADGRAAVRGTVALHRRTAEAGMTASASPGCSRAAPSVAARWRSPRSASAVRPSEISASRPATTTRRQPWPRTGRAADASTTRRPTTATEEASFGWGAFFGGRVRRITCSPPRSGDGCGRCVATMTCPAFAREGCRSSRPTT